MFFIIFYTFFLKILHPKLKGRLLFSLDFLMKHFIVEAINKGLFHIDRPVSF